MPLLHISTADTIVAIAETKVYIEYPHDAFMPTWDWWPWTVVRDGPNVPSFTCDRDPAIVATMKSGYNERQGLGEVIVSHNEPIPTRKKGTSEPRSPTFLTKTSQHQSNWKNTRQFYNQYLAKVTMEAQFQQL